MELEEEKRRGCNLFAIWTPFFLSPFTKTNFQVISLYSTLGVLLLTLCPKRWHLFALQGCGNALQKLKLAAFVTSVRMPGRRTHTPFITQVSHALSLSLSQHICITLAIASHLQRIWAWVHKHPWLHAECPSHLSNLGAPTRKKNRSRRRTRRSYIYVYVYVCAFLEIAHLITVPPYRYQLWNNLLSIFNFGMMRKDYSVPSWMESCTVGVVTSVVRIFLCSD